MPGKPAKFPKPKKKSSHEDKVSPKGTFATHLCQNVVVFPNGNFEIDEAAIADTVSKWVQETVSADPPPPPQIQEEVEEKAAEDPCIPLTPASPPPPPPSSSPPLPTPTTHIHREPPIDTLIQIEGKGNAQVHQGRPTVEMSRNLTSINLKAGNFP